MDTFIITHPKHGDAICDERQLDEFARLGWKKKSDADAEFKAADKNGDGKLSAAEKRAANIK